MGNMLSEINKTGYLLLVEDEPHIQANNLKILTRRGYNVKQAFTLADARAMIAKERPRAIILDIVLPDGNGLEFLAELRKASNIPVLMLTARGTPQDIIMGLETGGDDYLPKPYDLPIFLMRVQALLRRASFVPEMLSLGALRLDTASNKAYVNNADIGLQQKEFALLEQFMQHPEEIITAEHLYERVWGQKMFGNDNALKVAISKLRLKLDGSGYTVVASRGEGYCFERE